MRALRIIDGELRLERGVPRPLCQDEALVRVLYAGICNTDLEIIRGYAGFSGTLGHEFVGIVEESPIKELADRRVVGEINCGCGRCALCRNGDPRHCPSRTVLGIKGRDGAFADYLVLPAGNLHPVPDAISDQQAVFIEPLAAACEILEQVDIQPSSRVAVVGDGKLGLLAAQALKARTGCSLLLVGKHPEKMEIARRRGIETALASQTLPLSSFDCVVEASGSPAGLELALDLVRPKGCVALKSTFHGGAVLDSSRIVVNEVTIIGSRCGRFPQAIQLLEEKMVDVNSLISRVFALEEGQAAIDYAGQPGVLKVLLKP